MGQVIVWGFARRLGASLRRSWPDRKSRITLIRSNTDDGVHLTSARASGRSHLSTVWTALSSIGIAEHHGGSVDLRNRRRPETYSWWGRSPALCAGRSPPCKVNQTLRDERDRYRMASETFARALNALTIENDNSRRELAKPTTTEIKPLPPPRTG